MRAVIVILLCLNVFAHVSLAQVPNRFQITEYNTENGLPANGIKGLAYDTATHFLWVATEAGILRFNGKDFTIFSTRNLPGLSSERIGRLTRHQDGRILIFDTESNVFQVAKNKPVLRKMTKGNNERQSAGHSAKLVNKTLIQLLASENARMQLNTDMPIVDLGDTACVVNNIKSVLLIMKARNASIDRISITQGGVQSLFKVANQCFFGDKKGNLFLINPASVTTSAITMVSNGRAFTNEQLQQGLFCWDNTEQSTLFFLANKAYLITYDGSHLIASLLCDEIPVTSNIRYAVYVSQVRKLFIGTQSKGLIVVSPNYFTSVKKRDNNPFIPNATYSQILLNNQQILTNYNVLYGESNGLKPVLPIKEVFGLSTYTFGDSVLLYSKKHEVTQYYTIHRYSFKTGLTTGFSKLRLNNTFGAASSNGKLYMVLQKGFGIFQGDSVDYIIPSPLDSSAFISPSDMEAVAPGVFLTASCSGLVRFDANKRTMDTLLYFPGNCFRSIQKIGEYFFIGTYGAGYYMYHDGVLKKMPLDKAKYLLYSHCFMPDGKGFCFISTNRGLFKVSVNDMIRQFHSPVATSIYYHYYGKQDGIEMTEFNGGCTPCAITLQGGKLSFPTMDGLLWVHPDSLPALPVGGDVFIDEMLANDSVLINPLENISLPASTQSIMFKLGYNGWGNQENIQMEYSLGQDSVWKPIKTEQGAIIQLDNLPAGSYKLNVRKLNGFGKDNYTYTTLNFSIVKPWFNQWWFYFICVLLALAFVRMYLLYKTRMLQAKRLALERQVAQKTNDLQQKNAALEKSNSVQTRLISIISHDIITPLKFMAVGGKELMEKHHVMPETLRQETIEEITYTAQELQLLSTNIMNWMKYQNENRKQIKERFNLSESARQVTGILQSIARQKQLQIQLQIPAELEVFQYYEPLKILLYNLLSNAINFSLEGSILVSAVVEQKHVVLTVSDEGAGMTPEQIKNILSDDFIISSANIDNKKGNGLGYLIIKDLLKMIEGTLNIQSTKGKGTQVSVLFPHEV